MLVVRLSHDLSVLAGIARNCEDENAMMEMMGFTSFDSTKVILLYL